MNSLPDKTDEEIEKQVEDFRKNMDSLKKGQLTSQSSGRRFRIWHFINFRVSRSVSANLLKVVVLINITCKLRLR